MDRGISAGRRLIILALGVVFAVAGGVWTGFRIYDRGSSTRPRPVQDISVFLSGDEFEYEDVWWFDRVGRMAETISTSDARLIFIGDSIVEGWDHRGRAVWERYYEPRDALNLGIGGDRTEHVLWRLERFPLDGLSPEVAVVLIGVNNILVDSAAEVADGVLAVVDRVEYRLPETQIVLLAIFPGGSAPGELRERIDAANRQIEKRAGTRDLTYLDIGERFIEGDGRIDETVMWDYLHLTETGYERWAQALEPTLERLMGPVSVADSSSGENPDTVKASDSYARNE